MADHNHDCPKCNGYFGCDKSDCGDSDACLECQIETLTAQLADRDALLERWACESHPWLDGVGEPYTDPEAVGDATREALALATRTIAERDAEVARLQTWAEEAYVLLTDYADGGCGADCPPDCPDRRSRALLRELKVHQSPAAQGDEKGNGDG